MNPFPQNTSSYITPHAERVSQFSANLPSATKLWPPIHHQRSFQQHKESLAAAISTLSSSSSKLLHCLHARAVSSGLHRNLFISSLLITKYFTFSDAAAARRIFDNHLGRREKPLLWNSLISGYLRSGSPRLALDVFLEMSPPSSPECEPDMQSFHLAITACTRLSDFAWGFVIGNRAMCRGFCSGVLVATALVVMYAKVGDFVSARGVFDKMPQRDAVSWNAMISGYSQAGFLPEAMELFRNMRIVEGIQATEGSLVSLISCCGDMCWVCNGEALHGYVIRTGFDGNQMVLNSILKMYVECCRLDFAERLFDMMDLKDSVSWSTMIGGYVKNEHPSEALKMFHWMVLNIGVLPTRPILLNVLLACASLGDWESGMWIENKYLLSNTDEKASDSSLITALLYMYARCRKISISCEFLETDARVKGDVIAWNAVMKACAEVGEVSQVFELSRKMQRRGIDLDGVTLLMLISVISVTSLPRKGAETHAIVVKRGFESERAIANSLIDMYAQFGNLEDSCNIFEGIKEKDVISWSSMIRAYAWNGHAKGALNLFSVMREKEMRPNHFTFLALLSACSHGGYVEKGKELLASMEKEYGLKPGIEHLTCLIDMFCRAGLLRDAYHWLKNASPEASACTILWGALLSACRVHGNLVIGETAAKHLFFLEPKNAANYLMLADIYVLLGCRENANDVFRLVKEKKLERRPGCSWFDGG